VEPRRTASLDGLRGLAAAGIVVLHVWMFDNGDQGRPPKDVLDLAIGELRLGVPLFFVLSGFLVYRPFVAAALDGRAAPSLARYARRRAARILPAYWAALAGAVAILAVLGHERAVGLPELGLFLVFAQNASEATVGQVNPPMWSLGVEVSFYVALPVIALATARIGARRGAQFALCAGLVVLGAAFALWSFAAGWPRTAQNSLLLSLSAFGAGMTVAALLHRRGLRRRTAWVLALTGAALVVGDGAWHAIPLGSYDVRVAIGDLPAAIGFACVIAALAGGDLRPRALTCRPALALGDLSYAVYLWHFPVIYALRGAGVWPAGLAAAIALTMGVTLAIAAVSWFGLERPVLRRQVTTVSVPNSLRATSRE